MDKFTVHTGTAVPLRRSNVDTDQIIPAVYLKRVTRTGFEDGLFSAWRANEPDFVLNPPRFGDIFRGNSLKAGLLTVVLAEKIVQRLWDDIGDDPTTEVTVDLVECQVRWSGEVHGFDLDDYTRWRLLEGLDDIGLTLRHTDKITAYEATRRPWLP